MYTFDATYNEEGSARAERSFYLRSISELRRWSTFAPPIFFAIVVVAALALDGPRWFSVYFSVFLALSVAVPVFFYFARPLAAKRLARKYPTRQVVLTQSAIEIISGGQKAVVAWGRIKHVWSAGDSLLLVLGKFACINIPCSSLPQGANEFIRSSVASARSDA